MMAMARVGYLICAIEGEPLSKEINNIRKLNKETQTIKQMEKT